MNGLVRIKMLLTERLVEEHRLIKRLINVLERAVNKLKNNEEVAPAVFKQAVDFIRNFADKFHHAKEEDLLFKDLCSDEVEMHCNPTEQMRYEHDLGRGFVKGMIEALDKEDRNKLIENEREYCGLLRDHIYKEDNILYTMADESLSDKTQKSLVIKFKKIESKTSIKKYLDFAKKLK